MITDFRLYDDQGTGARSGWIETHNLPCYSNQFIVYPSGEVALDKPEALHDTDRIELAKRLTSAGVKCAIPVGKARQRFPQ